MRSFRYAPVLSFPIGYVFAAPLANSNSRRGLGNDILAAGKELKGAASIAVNRLWPSSAAILNNAISHLETEDAFMTMTAEQAETLIKSMEGGDAQTLGAVYRAVLEFNSNLEGAHFARGPGTRVLNEFDEVNTEAGLRLGYLYKPNKIHVAMLNGADHTMEAVDALNMKWASLGLRRQKQLIVGGGAVAATGVALTAALGGVGVGLSEGQPEYDASLDDESMQKLKDYIAKQPNQYQNLMKDVQVNFPNIPDDQYQELALLAPAEFKLNAMANSHMTPLPKSGPQARSLGDLD